MLPLGRIHSFTHEWAAISEKTWERSKKEVDQKRCDRNTIIRLKKGVKPSAGRDSLPEMNVEGRNKQGKGEREVQLL